MAPLNSTPLTSANIAAINAQNGGTTDTAQNDDQTSQSSASTIGKPQAGQTQPQQPIVPDQTPNSSQALPGTSSIRKCPVDLILDAGKHLLIRSSTQDLSTCF
ncbi:MAG: hypothetical protein Q9183_005745 [Haloplaca sp. 2 TL-2023]